MLNSRATRAPAAPSCAPQSESLKWPKPSNTPSRKTFGTIRSCAKSTTRGIESSGKPWAWQQFDILRHGYRVEEMQRERAAEEEVARQLRLEIETLKSPKRIEELATRKLHLVAPTRDEAIVIERVVPAEP